MSAYYHYLGTPNENLLCCICRMPFMNPVTAKCSHTFCETCIVRAIAHSPFCPIDRSPLTSDDLAPANPIVRSLVDELEIECIHKAEGCSYTSQRQLLPAHLKDRCGFSEVNCPNDDCAALLARKDLPAHRCSISRHIRCDSCKEDFDSCQISEHIESCQKVDNICRFCQTEMASSDSTTHESECEQAEVPCIHSQNGCPWKGIRSSLSSHTDSCPFEAIKGFFALNDRKMSTLKEENIMIRAKLEASESFVQSLRHEMTVMRHILGPWYRQGLFSNQVQLTNRPSVEDARQHSASHQGYSPEVSSPPNVAYFPSDLDTSFGRIAVEDSSRPYLTHRSSSSISQTPDSFDHRQFSHSRSTSAIAPLDLSTSLEGSLAGLRESLVSLATSVDSLGRRNDIALTNETMRLNEEVMSLRAAIHGLRLQVHTIMMDRNSQVTGRVEEQGWPMPPGPGRLPFPAQLSSGPSVTKL